MVTPPPAFASNIGAAAAPEVKSLWIGLKNGLSSFFKGWGMRDTVVFGGMISYVILYFYFRPRNIPINQVPQHQAQANPPPASPTPSSRRSNVNAQSPHRPAASDAPPKSPTPKAVAKKELDDQKTQEDSHDK